MVKTTLESTLQRRTNSGFGCNHPRASAPAAATSSAPLPHHGLPTSFAPTTKKLTPTTTNGSSAPTRNGPRVQRLPSPRRDSLRALTPRHKPRSRAQSVLSTRPPNGARPPLAAARVAAAAAASAAKLRAKEEEDDDALDSTRTFRGWHTSCPHLDVKPDPELLLADPPASSPSPSAPQSPQTATTATIATPTPSRYRTSFPSAAAAFASHSPTIQSARNASSRINAVVAATPAMPAVPSTQACAHGSNAIGGTRGDTLCCSSPTRPTASTSHCPQHAPSSATQSFGRRYPVAVRTSRVSSPGPVEALDAANAAPVPPPCQNVPYRPSEVQSVRLPVKLPRPQLALFSDPREGLSVHLRRHGLDRIADTWESCDMPCVYALHHWIEAAGGGRNLLDVSGSFHHRHDATIREQLRRHAAALNARQCRHERACPLHGASPPRATSLPVPPGAFTLLRDELDPAWVAQGVLPTHMLAVQSSDGSEQTSLIIPAHSIPYVLQCVSLPRFGEDADPGHPDADRNRDGGETSTTGARARDQPAPCQIHRAQSDDVEMADGDARPDPPPRSAKGNSVMTLPVVSLRVPSPSRFALTHRFLYTRDANALLCELLPMRYIVRTAGCYDPQAAAAATTSTSTSTSGSASASASQPQARAPLTTARAIASLSHLPTATLLRYARLVHSAWSNGVALGLLEARYWHAVDRAWHIVVSSLACRKARAHARDEGEAERRAAAERVRRKLAGARF